jgi:hypothetical protein
MTKKAGKHPRRWQGEFCAIKGEGACEPIFHHGKADATPKHAMNRVDEILAEIGSLA